MSDPALRDAVRTTFGAMRSAMIRERPPLFSRTEWATLVHAVDPARGDALFAAENPHGHAPRGTVSVWLPNNVGVLGPLMLNLLLLTGNRLRIKSGRSSDDLVGAWRDFLARFATPVLAKHLRDHVEVAQFDRTDPRNERFAREADVRIAFGGDAAVAAVAALPHRPNTLDIGFGDRQSEAWVEMAALDDARLEELAKAATLYAQIACTAPRRIVIVGGAPGDAEAVQQRLLGALGRAALRTADAYTASTAVMSHQWALAQGWSSLLGPSRLLALAAGSPALPRLDGEAMLAIVPATLDEAIATQAANVQTVGYVAHERTLARWRETPNHALRLVPVEEMHAFGPHWDGVAWWRACFAGGAA